MCICGFREVHEYSRILVCSTVKCGQPSLNRRTVSGSTDLSFPRLREIVNVCTYSEEWTLTILSQTLLVIIQQL